ncbi:MAG: putative porin, partial [Bacteroidota bacterium]
MSTKPHFKYCAEHIGIGFNRINLTHRWYEQCLPLGCPFNVMKYFLLLFLLLFGCFSYAQQDSIPRPAERDSLPPLERKVGPPFNDRERPLTGEGEKQEITIKDYKIISHFRDTTFLDTTLTIQKEYRYNYLKRDDFELMPFSNVGQPYNHLGVDFDRINLYPRMGASALHFNYLEMEDIAYYNVATPMTDLFFKTTFEQGQL